MRPPTFMMVAGDPSGDANGADLARALSNNLPGLRFIGAGGIQMAQAGVDLSFNLTEDAAIGPVDILKKLGRFRQRCRALAELAAREKPAVIILIDFYTFNQRLAQEIRQRAGADWQPKIVQYTSPQVWASRPGRAEKMAGNIDLLLCFFPFEKTWYARRGAKLAVECVGHPMFDRHGSTAADSRTDEDVPPRIVLLPGSRSGELTRHLPVMLEAARLIAAKRQVQFTVVAIDAKVAHSIESFPLAQVPNLQVQTGGLAGALAGASLAIACTGTVTMECAYFGVPAIALYKTSLLFYFLARSLITVKYLAMPNLLADEPVFPEFIQDRATAENLSACALNLLEDAPRRVQIREKLAQLVKELGGPGASQRAAALILDLWRTGVSKS